MMQVKNAKGEWIDIGDIKSGGIIEYREKPEKKPDVVMYACVGDDGQGTRHINGLYTESRQLPATFKGACKPDYKNVGNVSLTFSGETGELIKAEALK